MAELITFFGGDFQAGTTLLSMAVCQALARRGRRVLLIQASSHIDEEYFPPARAGLGTLLRISRITKEDVANCITDGPSYDYITGPDDMLKKQFFDPWLLEKIVDLAPKEYDLIIADGGCDVTLPLPVSALVCASQRFFVLTGGVKCAVRFSKTMQTVINGLGLDMKEDRIVLNKAARTGSSYSLTDLGPVFGMEGFSVPAYDDPMVYEFSKKTAYGQDSGYTRAVDQLAEYIDGGWNK